MPTIIRESFVTKKKKKSNLKYHSFEICKLLPCKYVTDQSYKQE